MARDHARLLCSVWGDADWTTRSSEAQRLYMLLVSQPDITYAGVVPYLPRRWASLSKDSSVTRVRRSLAELSQAAYVVVDESTEELLIRSFIRHDGVLKVPNVARAMVKAYRATLSPVLRDVVVGEVARLWERDAGPDQMKGWDTVMKPSRAGGMREDIEASLNGTLR
jgi:hypothetical protein